MSDDLPTTDAVAACYQAAGGGLDTKIAATRRSEFDRWLAEVKREAAAAGVDDAAQSIHDWAAVMAGPEGSYFARIFESRLRARATTIREGREQ